LVFDEEYFFVLFDIFDYELFGGVCNEVGYDCVDGDFLVCDCYFCLVCWYEFVVDVVVVCFVIEFE